MTERNEPSALDLVAHEAVHSRGPRLPPVAEAHSPILDIDEAIGFVPATQAGPLCHVFTLCSGQGTPREIRIRR